MWVTRSHPFPGAPFIGCAEFVVAVGGSLGKDRAEMLELLAFLMPKLPASKPRQADEGREREFVSFWQNFGKISLVFGCIKTKFCK